MEKARWPNQLIKKFGHLHETKDLAARATRNEVVSMR
jgi:hypothetical protein